ncbi:TetR/AcrR family transcriptional regulator [Actinoallomurus acaciae]|uniref:TetR/AcrR family transcriptional regulator n=1 Tax=Actinoallomurus acaciae TaxID=502577 RepID=A0ABV5YVN7_9ACTN
MTAKDGAARPPGGARGGAPMRADARRNRERVLRAAEDVFAEQGIAVPLDEIARRAGVGAGTVYRHFPTKEALFEAVIAGRVEVLMADADRLLAGDDPGEAFFHFFAHKVKQASLNKALSDALEASRGFRYGTRRTHDSFWRLVDELLAGAQRAGAVRADLDRDDVRALMVGCIRAVDQVTDPEKADHLIEVMADGMREKQPRSRGSS